MIRKRLEDITWQDIEELVTNRVGESRTIEFKCQLPGPGSDDKKEAVRDIASFANASGGDLIYGIKEFSEGSDKGCAAEITPIVGLSADKEKQRLDNLVRHGVAPPIGIQMREIYQSDDKERGFVLVLRIPQSVLAPHMVTLGDSYRFFSRTSSGKFPMKDVGEIRNAFLVSESQGERIRDHVRNRLAQIISGNMPVALAEKPKFVTHVIPILDFVNRRRADLSVSGGKPELHRIGSGLGSNRYNIDGLLGFDRGVIDPKSYAQLNFDGSMEVVDLDAFHSHDGLAIGIASEKFEIDFVRNVKAVLSILKGIDASLPISIFSSLVGAKGTILYVDPRKSHHGYRLDRDLVLLPEVALENWDVNVPLAVKPLFDALWNSYGFGCSDYYDPDGAWKLKA